ncbi:hypothetical protein GCM10008018_30850 [Paenibacillus marchantiophytorum]|uniref:Uncharacterized protein n=1 Tax=Paenibacillus marchantiophytorum TaxID=1619310 RepID=A0ABQ1EQN7_9BACL|nr:hypothetical protein [Paenibacillus marchantiophytorum]GFZ82806.1 hypothetical protein GCM10008018_30850 [Paenibacillus marchantiophytorum]
MNSFSITTTYTQKTRSFTTVAGTTVAIMDYRDYAEGADGIIANAQYEINYATSVGKKVIIGVETYDVPGSPGFVTFYQEGENYMNQELTKVLSYYSVPLDTQVMPFIIIHLIDP